MGELSALITLDGTSFSEEALSLVPFLKSLGLTAVHLVSVWEEVEGRTDDERLVEASERGRGYLTAYLQAKAAKIESPGLKVGWQIGYGAAAEEVLRVAEEAHPTLIVIATHGRTGIQRWRLGSVADKVIRAAACPTLVIGPNVSVNLEAYSLKRIMVPLDGSKLAEEALPVAAGLARRADAIVDLVEVAHLPTTWTADPMYNVNVADVLDSLGRAARDYLGEKDLPGVAVERTALQTMLTGGVAETLIGHLREKPAELVVATSHGRHGIVRSALGSVTDELLRGPAPVLVLRPGSTTSAGCSTKSREARVQRR